MSALELLTDMLRPRLTPAASTWFEAARAELAGALPAARGARFAMLLSLASRHARDRTLLAPGADERRAAARAAEGWEIERWTLLETLRVALVLASSGLETPAGVEGLEELFRYADEGEQRALYRSLHLLPAPERFRWRAGEGCRTNMRSVFEAVALDTPYPARFFDDVAWRQAVIKCVFIEAPLWRLWGLDGRLSEELARMALDLVDERRSAHRPVQPELWACLGVHGGERAQASLARELDAANPYTAGRRAALLALARSGRTDELGALRAGERDPALLEIMDYALRGVPDSTAFRRVRPEEG